MLLLASKNVLGNLGYTPYSLKIITCHLNTRFVTFYNDLRNLQDAITQLESR